MKTTNFSHLQVCFWVLFMLLQQTALPAQNILVMLGTTTNTIVSVNLVTCEQTPVAPGLAMPIGDFWMMPDGSIYVYSGSTNPPYNSQMYRYDPITSTTSLLLTLPISGGGGLYGLSDSTLLWQVNSNFYIYNINQNTATLVGTQGGLNGFSEIFEYNGNLYTNHPNGNIYQINLSPTFSTQQVSLFPTPSLPLIGVCNKVFGPVPGNSLFGELDVSTGTFNALCYDDFDDSGVYSWAPDPFNASGPLCDCTSEAGTFAGPPLLTACSLDPIPLQHNGNQLLDGDDDLVFVVWTYDYSTWPDVQYNILYTYTDPIATFIPGIMQTGELYAIMAVAANALPGTVDFTEPCADFTQNYRRVRWSESPTVSFSGAPIICGNGSCQTISATFTGSSPFSLTYQVTAGGNTQTFTQTFNSLTGSFQVCAPAGYSGPLTVNATNLVDGNSTCGN
jgi:hypothetical protein